MREAFDGALSSGAACAWLCGHTAGLASSSAEPVFSGMLFSANRCRQARLQARFAD